MRQYNKEELQLKVCNDKLEQTKTKRKLKEKLLAIINADIKRKELNEQLDNLKKQESYSPEIIQIENYLNQLPAEDAKSRLSAFRALRDELLSKKHGQGFRWTATLPKWLSWLFGFGGGSNLRATLCREPEINELPPLSVEDLQEKSAVAEEEQKDFDELLLTNPRAALARLHNNIKQPGEEPDNNNPKRVIEQLDALKKTLTPTLYQQLLEKLFTNYPKETLLYHYKTYAAALMPGAETPHEFIAYDLMARSIIRHFISSIDINIEKDLMNAVPFAIDKLLTLLNRESKKDKDWFLGEVLEKWNGKTAKNLLDNAICEAYSEPQVYYFTSSVSNHLLLDLVAKYAAEELFLIYGLSKGATAFHNEKPASVCIKDIGVILGYKDKEISLGWFQYNSNRTAFLNSSSSLLYSYQKSERIASDLIMNSAENSSLGDAANRIAKANRQQGLVLGDEDWRWIESRLKGVHSSYLKELPGNFIAQIEYILRQTHYYHIDELPQLACPKGAAQLIVELNTRLSEAEEARNNYQAGKENEASAQAVAIFNHLLTDPQLNSEEINKLQPAFEALQQYYLTENLSDKWQKKLNSRKDNPFIPANLRFQSPPIDEKPLSGKEKSLPVNLARTASL